MMNTLKIKKISTSNYDDWEIPVEYLILHYTGVSLEETLTIFTAQGGVVSAHIVIDIDGSIYEVVNCFDGKALRSRHAGSSYWSTESGSWEKFNDFSIGIELVNYNGNIFPYSDEQYHALTFVIFSLQELYPSLNNPDRILGHEHIAGFRGKADPGLCFDWGRLFQSLFLIEKTPERHGVCPKELQSSLECFKALEPTDKVSRSFFWRSVSNLTETTVKLVHQAIYER